MATDPPDCPNDRGATLVTGLFDLARREGSRRRSADDYLAFGELLLARDQDMVIFVEPHLAEVVERRRRAHRLLHRTRIVPLPLEGLPHFRLLPRIRRALPRSGHGDPIRFTAPYILVMWAKFPLLARVMAEDPFRSQRFAWVDFGIAHVAAGAAVVADRVFDTLAARIRLLVVGPFFRSSGPPGLIGKAPAFAAGLIAGDRAHLSWLTRRFEALALAELDRGRAGTDEDLLPALYREAPERFELYHGQYNDVLLHYAGVRRVGNLLWQARRWRELGVPRMGRSVGRQVLAGHRAGTLRVDAPGTIAMLEELFLAACGAGDRALASETLAYLRQLVARDVDFAAHYARERRRLDDCFGWLDEPEEAPAKVCAVLVVGEEAEPALWTLRSVRRLVSELLVVAAGSPAETLARLAAGLAEDGLDAERIIQRVTPGGRARAEALSLARLRSAAEHLWLLEAGDLLISGPARLGGRLLGCDGHRVRVLAGNAEQWCLQIVRRDATWRDPGVLHHPSITVEGSVGDLDPALCLRSLRLAGAGSPDRALAEAARLERELETAPDDPHRVFLLAQSRFGAGEHARALAQYRRRAELGGCEHERAYAAYRAGHCLERLERPEAAHRAMHACYLAHPTRAEPLARLAAQQRARGLFEPAFGLAQMAVTVPRPGRDALYVEPAVYDFQARDEYGVAAYHLGHHADALDVAAKLLWEDRVPEEQRPRIEANRDFSVPHLEDRFLRHDEALVAELAERIGAGSAADPQVTLTVVTRGPLEGLYATLDSFLLACGDLEAIDRFVCVDDCSTDAQRQAIAERYPFVELVCKDRDDQGRAGTMNILAEIVQTPYWLSLEAGWQFFERLRYATLGREILEADAELGQVLFNRNYAGQLVDRATVGGIVRWTPEGLRYVDHEHLADGSPELARFRTRHGPGARSFVRWPHYSLMPSLLRTEVVRAVGPHDEEQLGFELDFARRYAAAGYRSAFFDTICSLRCE